METKNSQVLSELQKDISIGGSRATDQGLLDLRSLGDDEHKALRIPLRRFGRGYPWWVGDYALSCLSRLGDKYAKPLSDDLQIDEGHIRNAADVASFYPLNKRRKKLSFQHHAAAIKATGGVGTDGSLAKAMTWLVQAEDKQWSVAELRTEINRAQATALPCNTPPEENPFEPLDHADKWAVTRKLASTKIEREEASMLVIRFAGLIEFIDRVRQIASGPSQVAGHR